MAKGYIVITGMIAVAVIVGGILLFNTIRFAPKRVNVERGALVSIDQDAVLKRFTDILRMRTVSHDDPAQNDYGELLKLHRYIDLHYPGIARSLKKEVINTYSLLYTWEGKNSALKPIILCAHMDVAPADPGEWQVDPFSGLIQDGYIWGRGTLDDKGSLVSLLEAVEYLVSRGFKPERTVYLAFGHDEEAGTTGGQRGAKKIAEYLESKGVHAAAAIDEGVVMLDEKASPIKGKKAALIGLAFKGFVSIKLSVSTQPGHAMSPPKETAIGLLSRAVANIEKNSHPLFIHKTMEAFFDAIGREAPFGQRVLLANRWLFGRLILSKLAQEPSAAALFHTTAAPTIIQSGMKESILPSTGFAIVNFRTLPGENSDDLITYVKRVIGDERVRVEKYGGIWHEPTPVSRMDTPSYRLLEKTIREMYPDFIVTPTLAPGRSDVGYYRKVADDRYLYTPYIYSPESMKMPHGLNESIRVDNYISMIQTYIRLVMNLTSDSSFNENFTTT